jgi:hypothetical protein
LAGRFNPEHEYEAHSARQEAGQATEAEGGDWEWYAGRFPAVAHAACKGVFARKTAVDGYFRRAALKACTGLDATGAPVLEMDGAQADYASAIAFEVSTI